MSAVDFAAAQERILARRAARVQAQQQSITPATPPPSALLALPAPLRDLALSGISAFDRLKSPYGTRPAFRVGQVDAELLDEELLTLFKGQVGDGLKFFGSHLADDYAVEILTALRLALWKFSIWDRGVSYGGHLQGLKYVDARSKGERDPSRTQKVLYGFSTVGLRYLWDKWEDWLLDKEGTHESSLIRRASSITNWLSSTHEVAAFASFLVFLYNGRYRTIIDRVLRLRLVPTTAQTTREVSFEYLNRQLVWHAFTEFLLFILPLVGISRWRRWLARAWKNVKNMVRRRKETEDEDINTGELAFLPERTCAICYKDQNPAGGSSEADVLAASSSGGGIIGSAQTDVTNPYEAIPCGDVYCFSCLAQRIEAEDGEGWTCLRCGDLIKACRPWNGDVIEEQPVSRSMSGSKGSRKSVVFVDAEDTDEEEKEKGEDLERTLTPVEPKPLEDDDRVVLPLQDALEQDVGLDGATSVEWVAYDEDVDEEQIDESGSELSDREVDEEDY